MLAWILFLVVAIVLNAVQDHLHEVRSVLSGENSPTSKHISLHYERYVRVGVAVRAILCQFMVDRNWIPYLL